MYYRPLNEESKGIDDLFSLAKGVINTTRKKEPKQYEHTDSSIAKTASKLIAVFPVLASRTVSSNTAQMVSKYIEQKACNLFIIALQQANIDNAKSGVEYLKKFHQNLDLGGDNVNAIIKTMGKWISDFEQGATVSESAEFFEDYSDLFECDHDLEISSSDLKELLEVMKSNSEIEFYDTKLNPISINDYVVREFENGSYHVSISNIEALQESKKSRKNKNGLREPHRSDAETLAQIGGYETQESRMRDPIGYRQSLEDQRNIQKMIQDDKDAEEEYNDKKKKKDKEEKEDKNKDLDRDFEMLRRAREEKERKDAEETKLRSGANVKILKDQDIKKMNNAVPSLLLVKFYSSSNASVYTEFVIGVKSKLIPVTTSEILRRIMNDNKDGKKFLNFMRAITGELKMSSIILGLSRIKDDVLSIKSKGSQGKIWNLLANRAEASNYAVKHGHQNDFSAISTVLISQSDVDELYREENFDISNPSNARHFMNSYNLMGFVIADDATETLKILMDDGEKIFSEYSYRMLERENDENGTYKKLINLMAASK